MTTLDRLRWYSKAVHYGKHMRHAEALRNSPRFKEFLRRVNATITPISNEGKTCNN